MTRFSPTNTRGGGLQAERTALAWSRTSLGILANGALLTVRDFHTYTDAFRFVAAGLAVAFALSAYLIGVGRQRTLARRPLPQRITPQRQVHLVGMGVIILILISAGSLLV